MRRLRLTWLVPFVALLLGGCYAATAPVGVPHAAVAVQFGPPNPVVQLPPPQPAIGTVWTAGYWDYRPDLRHYVWIPGRWVMPPRPGVVYLPPRWTQGRHGWVRLPPRWIRGQARDRYGRTVWFDTLGRPHYF